MIEIEINGVFHKPYPQIVLKQKDGDGCLHIPIGLFEAWAIALAHSDKSPSRPISYDLLCNLLNEVSARIGKVEITDMREGIFYAKIYLVDEQSQITTLDSRPSDAIALALRAGAPVFVAPVLLSEAMVGRKALADDAEDVLHDAPVQKTQAATEGTPDLADDATPAINAWKAPTKSHDLEVPAEEMPDRSDQLHKQLERAVAEEAYEEAARLRDEIARLEQG